VGDISILAGVQIPPRQPSLKPKDHRKGAQNKFPKKNGQDCHASLIGLRQSTFGTDNISQLKNYLLDFIFSDEKKLFSENPYSLYGPKFWKTFAG
jgi:hypothetical protein